MGKVMNGKISKWLNDKFLDLQKKSGKRWTVTEFSEYLDCPQPQVSRWLMGKAIPNATYVDRIAKLGDDIYDLVGLPRPDPALQRIKSLWSSVKEESKAYIVRVVEKAAKGD